MKTHVLVVPLLIASVALLWSPAEANTRSERSIREWFSSFMKRFQRKESRQEPFYLRPAHPSYFQTQTTYGHEGGGGNFYEEFQTPYHHQNSIGGGIESGFGGHNNLVKSRESEFHNHAPNHVTTNIDVKHSGSAGNPVYHTIESSIEENAPQGFGPLKNSDVIEYTGDGDISRQSHTSRIQTSGNIIPSVEEAYVPQPEALKQVHTAVVQGIDEDLSYEPPNNSIIQASPLKFSSSHSRLQNKEGSVALESHGIDDSSPIPSSPVYQVSSASNLFPSRRTAYAPHSAAESQLFVSGNQGQSYFAPQLGPDDPIIEIVFQDGEPLPPPPPPVIDESLYAPASDDVEVYFIEYSPEDNIEDLKNLDLSGAQPAILQNLPNELPPELREHLLTSGVLENAEIEILDLDKALTDDSLDLGTRNALRQAYTRTNRQAPSNAIANTKAKKQNVDIRVKRLNHDSSTPEGIVEFLSGLKSYRKGTFAGVVDVNNKNTDKYIPIEIDGRSLPVPDNIPLDNKKVEGVLVFQDSEKKAQQTRRPKSTFLTNHNPLAAASTTKAVATAPPTSNIAADNAKRMLNIQWADMESNGWIPIVNS
ncbi:UNVERIFIED_CONTAM: hypothetical protein RMT77_002283 [Armadillidium vulgare]